MPDRTATSPFRLDSWSRASSATSRTSPTTSGRTPESTASGRATSHNLRLVTKGETSSLADIEVRCSCGASRTMDGSFSPRALLGVHWCQGKRPWLPGAPDRGMSGDSRERFSVVARAPGSPTSDRPSPSRPGPRCTRRSADSWSFLKDLDEATLRAVFAQSDWIPEGSHWTIDGLVGIVNDIKSGEPLDEETLRRQEFDAIRAGHPERDPGDQFVCNLVELPAGSRLLPFVDEVREVSRLREVSALISFSRLIPAGPGDTEAAKLSNAPTDWLPAVEVFGEGIFVKLDETRFASWAAGTFARSRTDVDPQRRGDILLSADRLHAAASRPHLRPRVDERAQHGRRVSGGFPPRTRLCGRGPGGCTHLHGHRRFRRQSGRALRSERARAPDRGDPQRDAEGPVVHLRPGVHRVAGARASTTSTLPPAMRACWCRKPAVSIATPCSTVPC